MVPKLTSLLLIELYFTILLAGRTAANEQGALPESTFQGVALHSKDLSYAPNDDLIHPTIINTRRRHSSIGYQSPEAFESQQR